MCDLQALKNTVDQLPKLTYMGAITEALQRDFIKKQDDVIRKALIDNHIDPDDHAFLKANIQRIDYGDNDEFFHYYYRYGTRIAKRIISIAKTPDITNDYNSFDTYKMSLSVRYY